MTWVLPFFFFLFLGVLSIQTTLAEVQDESADESSCIPLSTLHGGGVQRGLGEQRKIRHVHLYLMGRGNVDVSVAVASRFLDESELTMPVLHQCGHYEGPIVEDSMKVGISCLEAGGDDSSSDGLSGYAVYAKFNGNLSDTSASICRMDIVLYDRKGDEKKQNIQSIIIFVGVIGAFLIAAGIGVAVWYFWWTKRERPDRLGDADVDTDTFDYEDHVIQDVDRDHNKRTRTLDEEFDEVFLPN